MCRWHKLAAKEAATNPKTGEFNVGQYAVALTAMGLLRVEQTKWNMGALFEVDGFNPREVLEDDAWQAFDASGLKRPLDQAKQDFAECVLHLRAALEKTAQNFDLSKDTLNITDIVTAEGYKEKCCAPVNPRENGPFLDAAVVYLAKGYDDETRDYATNILELVTSEELEEMRNDPTVAEADRKYLPLLEGVRGATEYFLSQPKAMETLQDAFASSIVMIFETAEDDLKAGRGLEGPSDCIMCEGVKGRKPKGPALK